MKVVINGETFDWDGTRTPMSEALAVEDVYRRRYAEWHADLEAGSAKAMCVLAWLIWRRDGRDVPFEDIISGKADFDLVEMLNSMNESALAAEQAAAAAERDAAYPTPAGPDPAGTATTGTATSASSPKPSAGRRRK